MNYANGLVLKLVLYRFNDAVNTLLRPFMPAYNLQSFFLLELLNLVLKLAIHSIFLSILPIVGLNRTQSSLSALDFSEFGEEGKGGVVNLWVG